MPVIEIDGQLHEFPDDFTDADIAAALGGGSAPPPPQEQSATYLPEAVVGARHGIPAAIRTTGRFAANHPAGIQRVIGTGSSAVGGILGGGIGAALGGGATGGVIGAMSGTVAARGLTPTQQAIREWAGRAAGEAPEVAKQAGRAVGIQEYIKNTSGYKVNPADILERPHGLPAAKSYAQSQGRDLMELVGPDAKTVVSGPTAVAEPAKKRIGGRLLTKAAKGASTLGKAINTVSGPIGITDFAQMVEPDRQDIGAMGIGRSVDVPGAHPPALEQLRAAVLRLLGQ